MRLWYWNGTAWRECTGEDPAKLGPDIWAAKIRGSGSLDPRLTVVCDGSSVAVVNQQHARWRSGR